MALSNELGNAGMVPKTEATATISLEKVSMVSLLQKATLIWLQIFPEQIKLKFEAAVKAAETGCPFQNFLKLKLQFPPNLNHRIYKSAKGAKPIFGSHSSPKKSGNEELIFSCPGTGMGTIYMC